MERIILPPLAFQHRPTGPLDMGRPKQSWQTNSGVRWVTGWTKKKIITFIPGRAGNIQNVRKRLYLFQKFNQCNLHHSPHTGDLEKKIKKKKVQSFSDILYIFKASIPALQCTQHHNVYRKFPKVKAARAWNWPLPPSSAKLNLLAPELFFFKF